MEFNLAPMIKYFSFSNAYPSPCPHDVVDFMEQLQEMIGYVRWMKDKFPTLPLEELEAAYKKVSSGLFETK